MRHLDLFAPAYCSPDTFGPNGKLNVYCFGGGAHAPAAPPAPVAPPKPDVPDNSAAQQAARKQGLQSTLLTGTSPAPGTLLGSSAAGLGNSAPLPAFGGPANAYGGQN